MYEVLYSVLLALMRVYLYVHIHTSFFMEGYIPEPAELINGLLCIDYYYLNIY